LPNEVASAGLVRTSAASCAGSRAGVDGGRPLDGSATRASSPSPSCRGVDDLAAGSKYGTLGAIRHQIARASNTLTSAAVGVSPTSSYPAAASNAAYSSAVRSRPPGPTSTPTASLAVGRQFTPSGVTGCPVVERAWPGVRSPDFTRHMLNPVRSSSSGRWTKAEPKPGTVGASMRSPCVVVGGVHGKRPAEMSLSEDQHSVGELGAHSQYEPFGVAVRSRAPWRDLDHLDARIREHRVERACVLPGRSRTRNRNRATCSPRSMTRLRACCVVHGPSGCSVTPRTCR